MGFAPDPSVLRGTELFQGLDDAALGDALSRGQVRRLVQGAHAFAQGDSCNTCHLLLHGRVKLVQIRHDGSPSFFRYIGPGQTFGTVVALAAETFPWEATAVVDSVQVVWTTAAMRELMALYPSIALRCIAAAGAWVVELQSRVGELCGERVEQRIARALARIARCAGRRTPAGIEIDFPLTRQELADMTGSTLHTVSRTLAAWDARGVTESSRRHIVVRQPHALMALAEDLPTPRTSEAGELVGAQGRGEARGTASSHALLAPAAV
ncbi:MAG: Crp/Fnr family transcriptional regulator [Pseudomonadota bacterium]|jgi:CRP-like cAMP-binding protein